MISCLITVFTIPWSIIWYMVQELDAPCPGLGTTQEYVQILKMSKKLLIFHGAEELTRYINQHSLNSITSIHTDSLVCRCDSSFSLTNLISKMEGTIAFHIWVPSSILNLSNCISYQAFNYVCLPFRKVIARGLANLWNSQSAVRLATLHGQTTAIFSFTLTTAWPKVKKRGCILPGTFLQKSEDILAYFWDTLYFILVLV